MRLADENTELTLGGELIVLRPTLQCGFRLERREGSFAKLIADLQEGSLSAASFVLADAIDRPTLGAIIMDAGVKLVCAKLIAHAINCTGIDQDAKSDAADGPPISFGEHLVQLYRIATGWLGWTPEVAFDATPAEITEAYKGLIDKLKAIHGDNEPEKGDPSEKLKAMFADKGAIKGKRRAH